MELHRALQRDGASGYFASANSGLGFYSLYGEIFNEENYRSVYIIKGGPGTGKSTFIDMIAERAAAMGYECELFLCSSDAKSLDGLIIKPLRVAVVDGTAPHSREPAYPGACGEIIDLGALWDSSALKAERTEILALGRKKYECYERAYRLLSAAATAYTDMTAAAEQMSIDDKMKAAVSRLLNKYIGSGSGSGKTPSRRFVSANTQSGKVTLTTPRDTAEKLITVSAALGFGHRILDELFRQSSARGLSITAIPDVLLPTLYHGIYINDAELYVHLIDDDDDKYGSQADGAGDKTAAHINSGRFIDREKLLKNRKKLKFTERIRDSLTEEARASLYEAGELHFKLEEIYKSSMDFDAVRELERKTEHRIFG